MALVALFCVLVSGGYVSLQAAAGKGGYFTCGHALWLEFAGLASEETAFSYCLEQGKRGDAEAQRILAGMYREGRGARQDKAEAAKWYRKAAEQGNARAQYFLGFLYRRGEGVAQDSAEAAKWYLKAAKQGDGRAQLRLGRLHESGEGVAADAREAFVWYWLAAAQGMDGAAEKRDALAAMLDAAALKSARAEAARRQAAIDAL